MIMLPITRRQRGSDAHAGNTRPSAAESGASRNLRRISRVLSTVVILSLILMIAVHSAGAASEGYERFSVDDPNLPWNIVADRIRYDKQAQHYIADGNVIISKADRKLTADAVRFDQKNMQVFATGHVMMTAGQDVMTGSSLEIDLNSETGTLYQGAIFIQESHFYIQGAKLRKTGKKTYAAERASFTSCDGQRPAWRITGRDFKVTLEGYGVVKHATLWAKQVPLFYTPYFAFPAKRKRQSGLLDPEVAISDRKGIEYTQPLYWAINESSDATFYAHYLQRRGLKLASEYRYVLGNRSRGTIVADWLEDRKVDDGIGDATKEFGFSDDAFLRPNSDRYWIRAKVDHALPRDFNAKLDLDFVSDQDYLLEFKEGVTGFYKTDRNFFKTFGRDVDEFDDTERVNRLNIYKIWPKYSLNTEIRWLDNVIARRQETDNLSIQQLPSVDFDASRRWARVPSS